MTPEPRLIILTNDATILALSDFPYYISRWGIESESLEDIVERDEREAWILKTTLKQQLRSINPDRENPRYLTINDRLFSIPLGFKPKISWIECVTSDGDYLRFERETIKPKNIAEKGFHKELLERMDIIWYKADRYYEEVKGEKLENKTPSTLILISVNGDKEKATNQNLCWHYFDQIVHGGSELAKTPICIPVWRSQVQRNVYEYQIIERQKAVVS